MELKPDAANKAAESANLLIVPYGIETLQGNPLYA